MQQAGCSTSFAALCGQLPKITDETMKNYQKAVVAVVVMLTASAANAAGSDATTAITAIGTEASAIIAAAWPVLTAITVAFAGMKLFKKATGKAT